MESHVDGARSNVQGDLRSATLPEADDGMDSKKAADALFRWVEAAAIETVNWYIIEKKSKARWSRRLRMAAILFATVGSFAPFVAVGLGRTTYSFWGYPLLALGAGCIGLDRVFGFSSSWMRYQASAVSVQRLITSHQLRWAEITRNVDEATLHVQWNVMLNELRGFAEELSEIVINETQKWVEEFRGHFSQLEMDVSRM